MKQFKGYSEAKEKANFNGAMKLPAGAYVCKVMGVKYVEADSSDKSNQIVVQFDIAEGDQKDFFTKQYASNTDDNRKYKGVARIYEPKDDGSDKDAWTKNTFARWTNAFEKSNPGYAWDWDENKWKGLMIGIVFGECGNVINGKEVKYTEVRAACSVDDVKNGTYWEGYLKFKAKNGYTGISDSDTNTANNDFMSIGEGVTEEIPFN